MKKIISALAASGMLIAAVAPSYASAINIQPLNELSIESEVLTEGITVDGTYIPSGAMAVTVNIDNNAGFDNSKTVLELGDAFDVIENDNNKPLIVSGTTFGDSHFCAAEANNIMAVASASADIKDTDGSLFTFYVNVDENSDDREIRFLDIPEEIPQINNGSSIQSTTIHIYVGDVNEDDIIDARDASDVLHAYSVYVNDTYGSSTPPSSDPGLSCYTAAANPLYYFDYSYANAWAGDTDFGDYLNPKDADDILDYYVSAMVNPSSYDGIVGYHFARIIY